MATCNVCFSITFIIKHVNVKGSKLRSRSSSPIQFGVLEFAVRNLSRISILLGGVEK